MVRSNIKNSLINLIYIFLVIMYYEMFFSLATIGEFGNILMKILFTGLISIPILVILQIVNQRISKKVLKAIIIATSLIFCTYYIYYNFFEHFLSIYSLINGGQVLEFSATIFLQIINKWYMILIFILPIFVHFFVIDKKIYIQNIELKNVVLYIVLFVLIYIVAIVYINVISKDNNIYSAKNVYYNIHNNTVSLQHFGLLTTIRIDLQRSIIGFEESVVIKLEDDKECLVAPEQYNVININFDELISNEKNDKIKQIHQYISRQMPSKKNEYTGLFKGKNLIVFVAESFSNLAIKKDITPTLYKLYNEGITFNNFYTPLFPVSTADGEYLTDLSLIPAENTWSIEKVAGNYLPYSYGNAFKKLGYKTYAYHNYNYDYYNRDKYFETTGYNTYLGIGNGLEKKIKDINLYKSDYEMVKNTIDDYINEENFVVYYMTMSGHINYDNTNPMVTKNWGKVEKLPYSDKAKAYLATQIELDKALEELINRLKQSNKLDDTVIVISADHYPYGLTLDEMKELSDYNIDYVFDKFKMPFIVYNSSIDKNIQINKYGSSLDILPTVLNLFGVKFDSRLLMGRDILSDAESLVIFSNRSFITNIGRYNSLSKDFLTNYKINEQDKYIENINNLIYLKYKNSRLILENNYYEYLKQYIKL